MMTEESKNGNGPLMQMFEKVEKKKKSKPSNYEKYCALVFEMAGLGGNYPNKYLVTADEKGIRNQLEVSADKVVKNISIQKVADDIMQYLESGDSDLKFGLEPRQALECAKYWRSTAPIIAEESIHPVCELSTDAYTWRRLPFDLADGPSPLWDEITSRISDPVAYTCFVGSLFFKDSDRQQYIFCYGEGDNSKGSQARFLHEILGKAFTPADQDAVRETHWTASIVGARLVVFGDCDKTGFLSSGKFKSLTGGDAVSINEKSQPRYTAKLQCKFMIISNEPPEISSKKSDLRRAIYCQFGEIPEGKRLTELYVGTKLMEEAPAFLWKCREMYLKKCPHHERIPTNDTQLKDVISSNEEILEDFFIRWFQPSRGDYVTPQQLQMIFREEKIVRSVEQNQYKGFLARKYGVKRIRIKRGQDSIKIYRGMGILDEVVQNYEAKIQTEDVERIEKFIADHKVDLKNLGDEE